MTPSVICLSLLNFLRKLSSYTTSFFTACMKWATPSILEPCNEALRLASGAHIVKQGGMRDRYDNACMTVV